MNHLFALSIRYILSTPIYIENMSSQVAKAARRVTHELHGVVVSAGLMQKTVKVRVGGQKWNKVINKVSRPRQVAEAGPPLTDISRKVVRRPKALPRTRSQLLPPHRRRRLHRSRLADLQAQAPRYQEHHCAIRHSCGRATTDSHIRGAHRRTRGQTGHQG